jgi:1,4-dihydroxy-2-naphthoate octaprenyltransferase
MQAMESSTRQSPITAGKLFRALRAFSLPASILPVFVAVAAAVPISQWHWGVLIASAAGAGLLHVGGNLLNDYFDFRKGVDRRMEGDENRPGRLLVRGELTPRDELVEAVVCLALAAGIGAVLAWRCGLPLVWFGLAGAAGAYAYTGPPFHLKYRALGEAVIFVVFGPLLLTGAAWAQTQRWEWAAFLASIPVGLATTAILTSNNLRDRDEDSQGGIRTIGNFAGGRFARALYVALVLGAPLIFAVIGALGFFGVPGAGPRGLLVAPLSILLIAGPARAVAANRRIPDIDARTARFAAVLYALAFLAYAIDY